LFYPTPQYRFWPLGGSTAVSEQEKQCSPESFPCVVALVFLITEAWWAKVKDFLSCDLCDKSHWKVLLDGLGKASLMCRPKLHTYLAWRLTMITKVVPLG